MSLADHRELFRVVSDAWQRLWWVYLPFTRSDVPWTGSDATVMLELAGIMQNIGLLLRKEDFRPAVDEGTPNNLQLEFVEQVLLECFTERGCLPAVKE